MAALLTAIAVMISWLMVEKPAAMHSVISVVVPLRTNKKNHAARVIAVDVILALSLVGCAQGITHAPAKTAMQIQLGNRPHNWNAYRKPNTCCCAMPCRHRQTQA